jgi:7-cyano-7-deazaguanine synthase in queuosine biosynthesis
MRTVNIIATLDATDTFVLPPKADQLSIPIPLDQHSAVSTNAWEVLLQENVPSRGPLADLLRLAITVYTADQIISRKREGYQGWSRHIRVYLPVLDLVLWQGVQDHLEKMLSFLSGDKWEFNFRQAPNSPAVLAVPPTASTISAVSLFSGGLDSLVGVIDLLEAGHNVALVSHYKRGSEHGAQETAYRALEGHYGTARMRRFEFYVQPNQKNPLAKKEGTSRARSFLFLALGLNVARIANGTLDLVVPENGLISLNVPLTDTRLSSHSTRTTHPHYFDLFRTILSGLGIGNSIVNPYQLRTKGEMMQQCANQTLLAVIYPSSISCSHADISRLTPGSRPGIHCGYCVPCIIRQAAEYAYQGIRTGYVHQIKVNPPDHMTGKGRDLRAFKMALEELTGLATHSVTLRVLKSGPLPIPSQTDLEGYVGTYQRGMAEVRNFLA